jgi:hypothetical protein
MVEKARYSETPLLKQHERQEFADTLAAYRRDPSEVLDPPWVIPRRLSAREARKYGEFRATVAAFAVYLDQKDGEPWLVRTVLRTTAESTIVAPVSVEHFESPTTKEVTGAVLRNVPVAAMRRDAVSYDLVGPVVDAALEIVRGEKPRRGRPGPPDDYFVQLAYEALTKRRHDEVGTSPREQLRRRAEKLLGRPLPADTLKAHLAECAKRGLLAGGTRGRHYTSGPELPTKESNDG